MGKKNSMIPMPTGQSSVLPKVIGGLVVLALLAVVIKHPGEAAGWARGLVGWAGGAVDGIASFFEQVAG